MIDYSKILQKSTVTSHSISPENFSGKQGQGGKTASVLGTSRKGNPCLRNIKPNDIVTLADIKGSGAITHIWMTVTNKTSDSALYVLRDLVLRMYWDEEDSPSVEVPLGDFFCCGFGEDYLVNSALVVVIPARGLNSYIRMPFKSRALITIENQHANVIPELFYQIDYELGITHPEDGFYFHAQWRRENITQKGVDYTVLDGVKGEGAYIGTFLALSALERHWWGEGEVKIYLDGDEKFPTICGTGLEDYFGGSWSFAKQEKGKTVEQTYSTRYLGYPFYSKNLTYPFSLYHNDDCPPMRAFYRWHLPDPILFRENIRVTVQQIGSNAAGLFERQDDYSSVAYWYQTEPHIKFPPLPNREDRWPR